MEHMISIIIPSRNEQYLDRTIIDIQENAGGVIEIIAIMEGYRTEPINGVKYIYNEEAKGMRTAINQGVAAATGEYIMKCDAHCSFDKGFDIKLVEAHQPNWVQVPRRKRLDPKKWEPKDDLDIDYMYLHNYKGFKDNNKNRDQELKNVLIDDTEIFQGSCYFMTKEYFNKLGLLDDINFGKMGSESLEIVTKCKHDGGRIVVNKNTWYAHAYTARKYAGSMVEREKSREFIKTLIKQLK
jgi:glycosyltransferase involved in cell wall biosynthesis